MINIKDILYSKIILIINSIIISTLIWSIFSRAQIYKRWYTASFKFYNKEDNITIKAPGNIKLELCGQKEVLDRIHNNNLNIYINAQELNPGDNYYIITNENLLLPQNIKIIDFYPHNINIILEEK